MKKKVYLLLIVLFFFQKNLLHAELVNNIKIIGNKNIQIETIIEYGKIKLNKNYSSDDLNEIQKKIYQTGFFDNIKISLNDNILLINVKENPLIDFYTIKGDTSDTNLNKIYDLIKLGSNKIYSDFQFKKDLDIIKDFYLANGYSDIEVIPRISKLDNDKVNILITVNKKELNKINRIYFVGNKNFKSSDLLDVISSSETGWWKFLTSTDTVNRERISYDQILLKNFYLDKGYFDIQISSTELKKISKNKFDIIFSINSGNLYNFGTLKIVAGESLVDQSVQNYIKILDKEYLKKNYSNKKTQNFLDKLNYFIAKSKLDFVEASIEPLKNINKIDLNLKFSSQEKKYIDKIKITGNSITEEEVIRRDLNFSEGDSYIDYKKKKSTDNLKALGIFKDVATKVENIDENKVNVFIDVTEQPTGNISAGAGYGGNGATIAFGLSEKNFIGKGIGFNADVSIGTQQIYGNLGLVVPDFMNSDKTLYSNIRTTKLALSNTLYESKKTGLDLATKYEIYEGIFIKPGYGIDYEKIDVLPEASTYLKSQNGNYFSQKINYNIEKDSRDNRVGTREGSRLGFTQELSYFGSDIPYFKNIFYGSTYLPVTEKQTINIRYGYSNITAINNNENIKISDRLFVPYQYSKGFEPRGLGPKDTASNDFIGGNNSFYSTLSATLPNPVQDSWNMNTIAFMNAMNVWGVDNNNVKDSNVIRSSIGIGIDWRTPIGPLSLSLAKPITKADTDKTKIFSFEIGSVF